MSIEVRTYFAKRNYYRMLTAIKKLHKPQFGSRGIQIKSLSLRGKVT